jgi:phthiodiolone/phenolphthiodiolone dimycocerosates ketoreductase
VNRDSPYFPLHNAVFDLPPYRGKWPEIWIAAHGPRMLRAAGRYGDGFFPAFSHTPQEYARRLEVVRTAASDAGRDPMSIIPAMCLPVLTGRTRAEVDEAMESELVKAGALNASDEVFARHGAQHPLGVGFAGAQDILPQDWDEQTALSYIKTIPSSLLRDTALVGTAGEVIEKAAEWRDCGVSHVVLLHCSLMQRSLRNGLAAMGPFLKIIRGLKKL